MNPGTTVRLKADPGRVGIITGKTRLRAGKTLWQVKFPDGADYHREIHLEIMTDDDEDPIDLLREGKLGRSRDLRGNLTHIRLTGRLANLIYSMNITNTDFYPYQFKPVLNLLDAPSNGLLIADEVGLGKTIEAGLIWTELRSRFDIRRVMVLCPAMLREKWQTELSRRFGIEGDILGSSDVMKYFREYKAGERQNYAMICSMQGLRPRRGWEREAGNDDNSSVLARFLESAQYEEHLLDLLIVDEAHYFRNPESMTSRLGRLLRSVSDYVLLLSATPIHLRNRDLYQLLNLVDENTFNQPHVFDEILQANEPLIRLKETVLHRELDQESFVSMLEDARAHPFFSDNRQIRGILENPPSDEELREKPFRTMIANRLESINLLGRSVNRTRKRDITEWRVIREPVAEMIPMSEPERRFYDRITELIREYALRGENHEGFLVVMPQRQMASSMAAAIQVWQEKNPNHKEQLYEDIGEDEIEEDLGPLTRELVDRAYEMGDFSELRANDSKYARLREMLTNHLNRHPDEKIVLFAYFRQTLKYLNVRLGEDGIESVVLMGGQKADKYETIEKFSQRQTRLSHAYPPKHKCRFENLVSPQKRQRIEIISQFHPLVRFVSDRISNSSFKYYSPVSVELNRQEIPDIESGVYVFSVERWSVKGIREIERLHVVARDLAGDKFYLDDDVPEKLVTTVARLGKDWQAASAVVDFEKAAKIVELCMESSEKDYEEYIRQLNSENNDRADVQEKSLTQHRDRQLSKLDELLARQTGNEKVARMTRGRIDALNSRVKQKLIEIENRRKLNHHPKGICIGLIHIYE